MNTKSIRGRTRQLIGLAAIPAVAFVAVAQSSDGSGAGAAELPESVSPAREVAVAQPTVRRVAEWDEYTGRFVAAEQVEVRARVSGYLNEISFTDGELVDAGDLLFRIDPRPFEAEVAGARAEQAAAAARLENATNEFARAQTLEARAAFSQEETDRRERALREAQAALALAEARTERALLDLEFTQVRAPISGRISDDFVSEGNLIVGGAQGGTLLTRIVALDPIHFEFTASEADYLKYVRLGQSGARPDSRDHANPVRLRLIDEQAFDHAGVMSFVDNRLDPSTGTMRGRATFGNADGVFAPGMFARLQVVGTAARDTILVPDAALQTDQGARFLWIVDADDQVARVNVTTGPLIDGLRVVRSGLVGDERVVVGSTQFVGPGMAVRPIFTEAPRIAAR